MKLKHLMIFCLTLALVAGFVFQAQAGHQEKKGTCTAEELLLPVGSRGSALGGACLATVAGVDAIYWNPAGLAHTSKVVEAMFSHHNYIADIGISYAAVGIGTRIGTIGVSFKTFQFGEIDVTTETAPEGTGASFSPTFMTFGLTYSKAMTDRIYMGVNAKLITETIMEMNTTGVAFDMGVQYVTRLGVRVGVAMKNWGPAMQFTGENMEHRVGIIGTEPQTPDRRLRIPAQKGELPSLFEIGVAYDYSPMENLAFTAMGNFRNHNFGNDEYMGALELCFNDMFFLRGAYSMAPLDKEISGEKSYLFGPSFGFGINYAISQSVSVALDYAYRTAEFFDDNQFFTLTFGF